MNELLKKLLEAEILTADTKQELEEAFASQLNDAITEAKTATEEAVRLELAEQWVQSKDALVEAIDTKVVEMLNAEVTELKESIDAFRDLEVEYAAKLNEAKETMATQVKADVGQLIEKLDTFLELRIAEEFSELKTSIDEAKKLDFGRKVFESFMAEYQAKFVDESEVHGKLAEAEAQLQAVTSKLTEATAAKAKVERTLKLEGLLAPLAGTPRQLMETILSTVETKDLDKTYTKFIGRVLKEAAPATPEVKEDKVLAEGEDKTAEVAAKPVVKTGDMVTESQNAEPAENALSDEEKTKIRRMSGIAY